MSGRMGWAHWLQHRCLCCRSQYVLQRICSGDGGAVGLEVGGPPSSGMVCFAPLRALSMVVDPAAFHDYVLLLGDQPLPYALALARRH